MQEYGIYVFLYLIIEQLEVNTIQYARKREGEYMKLIMPSLNKNIAGRDARQHQIDNYEALKNYRRNYYRTYRQINYQSLKLYRQQYYRKMKIKSHKS